MGRSICSSLASAVVPMGIVPPGNWRRISWASWLRNFVTCPALPAAPQVPLIWCSNVVSPVIFTSVSTAVWK